MACSVLSSVCWNPCKPLPVQFSPVSVGTPANLDLFSSVQCLLVPLQAITCSVLSNVCWNPCKPWPVQFCPVSVGTPASLGLFSSAQCLLEPLQAMGCSVLSSVCWNHCNAWPVQVSPVSVGTPARHGLFSSVQCLLEPLQALTCSVLTSVCAVSVSCWDHYNILINKLEYSIATPFSSFTHDKHLLEIHTLLSAPLSSSGVRVYLLFCVAIVSVVVVIFICPLEWMFLWGWISRVHASNNNNSNNNGMHSTICILI
jgi:hypothetical protein